VIITAVLAPLHGPAEAKGPADRITITGPGLAGELVIEDRATLDALSMGGLENFRLTLHEIPANPGPGYELTRYYKDGDRFWPFDRVRYYPDLSGTKGYVFFIGIVNGSSDYDGKWFAASPPADRILRQTLAANGVVLAVDNTPPQPALILARGSGELYVADAASLATRSIWQVADTPFVFSNVIVAPDGRTLYYTGSGPDGQLVRRSLDLSGGAQCSLTQQVVMVTASGQQVLVDDRSAAATVGTGLRGTVLEIRDPATFDRLQTLALPGSGPIREFFASPDRHWLFVLRSGGDATTLHLFNTTTQQFEAEFPLRNISEHPLFSGVWDTSGALFFLTDGERLHVVDASRQVLITFNPHALRDLDSATVDTGGAPFVLAGARGGRAFLYHPLGRTSPVEGQSTVAGGLFVFDQYGQLQGRWRPEVKFAQVIYQDGRLYGLITPRGTEITELDALDAENGEVLAQWGLELEAWTLHQAWLDPDVIGTGPVHRTASACDRAEP
jgi:sugar lactone lactonase YvrE